MPHTCIACTPSGSSTPSLGENEKFGPNSELFDGVILYIASMPPLFSRIT